MPNKQLIIDALAERGWVKDRICDVFQKDIQTFRGTAPASFWLVHEAEFGRWWLKDSRFESAGENVLAGNCAIIPEQAGPHKISDILDRFCGLADLDISRAYSVRRIEVLK